MSFLGISAHQTTVYHTQGVSYIQDGWVSDPIATMGASAIAAQANDIAASIVNGLQNGAGFNVRKYYQYATRRFRKRNVAWQFNFTADSKEPNKSFTNLLKVEKASLHGVDVNEMGIDTLDTTEFSTFLHNLIKSNYKIMHENIEYSYSGAKFYYDMDTRFGWNDLTEPLADGTNVIITQLEPASNYFPELVDKPNCWVVGYDAGHDNRPVVILGSTVDKTIITSKDYYLLAHEDYIPEPSVGFVYWYSSQGVVNDGTIIDSFDAELNHSTHVLYSGNVLPISEVQALGISDLKDGERIWISKVSDWVGLNNASSISIDPNNPEPKKPSSLKTNVEHKDVLYIKKVAKSHNGGLSTKGEYLAEFEVETITYDKIGYVWLTNTGKSSHSGIQSWFNQKTSTKLHEQILWNSEDTKTKSNFKLYPYLPIEEFDIQTLDFGKAVKLYEAVKTINGIKEDNDDYDGDAPVINRKANKSLRNKKRVKTHDLKSAQRVVASSDKYSRKVKVREYKLLKESDKRHLEVMGDLLGYGYTQMAANAYASDGSDKVYHTSLMPSVQFGSNYDEPNYYWLKFFQRLYNKLGNGGYDRFESYVSSMANPTASTLPRYELNWQIPNGQGEGFISFAYIKKLRIKGSIRQTKRVRNTYEIRRGVHNQLHGYSGSVLRSKVLNPVEALADNEQYYTNSKSEKQYNIGGAEIIHDPVKLTDQEEETIILGTLSEVMELNPSIDIYSTFATYTLKEKINTEDDRSHNPIQVEVTDNLNNQVRVIRQVLVRLWSKHNVNLRGNMTDEEWHKFISATDSQSIPDDSTQIQRQLASSALNKLTSDDRTHMSDIVGKTYNSNVFKSEFYEGFARQGNDVSRRSSLMYDTFGYTFFCKEAGNGYLDVYAVAGLVSGIKSPDKFQTQVDNSLDGEIVMANAWAELELFYRRNQIKLKVSPKSSGSNTSSIFGSDRHNVKEMSEQAKQNYTTAKFTHDGGKYETETRVVNFFVMPMEYKTVSRLGAVHLERLTQRSILVYTWSGQRVRGFSGLIGFLMTAIASAASAISLIYGGVPNATWTAILTKLATQAVLGFALSYGLKLIIKLFGLKGLVALITAIVGVYLAAYAGMFNTQASLPYASQISGRLASQVMGQSATQLTAQSLSQTIQQSIRQAISETLKSITEASAKQLAMNITSVVNQGLSAYNKSIQEELASTQNTMQKENEAYQKAVEKLNESKDSFEKTLAPFDVKTVMHALTSRIKLVDPDIVYAQSLVTDNTLASEEYLSGFLNMRLNLEPSVFDAVKSLDFSLEYANTLTQSNKE